MPTIIEIKKKSIQQPYKSHTDFFLTIRNSFKNINDKTKILSSSLEEGKESELKIIYKDLIFIENIVKKKITFLMEFDNKLSIFIFSDENKEEENFLQNINDVYNDIKTFEKTIEKIKKKTFQGKINIITHNIYISMCEKLVLLLTKHACIQQKYKKRIEERYPNDFQVSKNIKFSLLNEKQIEQEFLKEKNEKIIEIEKKMNEILLLIKNIHKIVELQGENVSLIQRNIEETKKYIYSGYKEVSEIRKEYKKTIKNLIIIIILGIVLVFLVLLKK